MTQIIQVEFKGSRRELFSHADSTQVRVRDVVVVPVEHGEDIGTVSKQITEEIAPKYPNRAKGIIRIATADDRLRLKDLRERELQYRKEVIQLIRRHGLVMKIVDVEIQFDYTKVTIYFTADHRVDFRTLVRDLAAKYRTRIELRQIGVRDEARRVDGYGVCGQRQCCSGHLKEFAPITTSHAREQDLSLNPQKISGNCGRLLCCLRYEVEMYAGVKKLFPAVGSRVTTPHGSGVIDRIDYFKEQAVVITEDYTQIRANSDEILSVESAGRGRKRGRGTGTDLQGSTEGVATVVMPRESDEDSPVATAHQQIEESHSEESAADESHADDAAHDETHEHDSSSEESFEDFDESAGEGNEFSGEGDDHPDDSDQSDESETRD